MPIAAMSPAATPAWASASRAVASCDSQISRGSCSTQPGLGKICRNSRCAMATMEPSAAKTMLRELEVPWSRASRCVLPVMGAPYGLRPIPPSGNEPLRAAGQGSWALLAGDAVDARLDEQLGKGRGRSRVGEQAVDFVKARQLDHRRPAELAVV